MIEYIVFDNGDRYWYNQKNELHREDGPAVKYADGTKLWYRNGQCHREDGPAIEWVSGSKEWWVNGKRHHEDGPAIECADGTKAWYLRGKKVTEKEFNRRIAKVKELTVAEISELLGYEVKIVK